MDIKIPKTHPSKHLSISRFARARSTATCIIEIDLYKIPYFKYDISCTIFNFHGPEDWTVRRFPGSESDSVPLSVVHNLHKY